MTRGNSEIPGSHSKIMEMWCRSSQRPQKILRKLRFNIVAWQAEQRLIFCFRFVLFSFMILVSFFVLDGASFKSLSEADEEGMKIKLKFFNAFRRKFSG
jgi:hypothetical protein